MNDVIILFIVFIAPSQFHLFLQTHTVSTFKFIIITYAVMIAELVIVSKYAHAHSILTESKAR